MKSVATRALAAFVTGLLFLAPIIVTIVVLDWLAGYVTAAVGPESFLGRAISSGGSVVVGGQGAALAFWVGLLVVLLLIALLGLLVQTRLRRRLEEGFDRFIDRVPVLRSVYRPIAQLVRLIGPQSSAGNLDSMRVVAVRFGDATETLALLVTPELFDVGGQPRQLVLLTTAPVPVGGALLFVEPENIVPVEGLSVEDFIKFFVSVGTVRPSGLKPYTPPK
ncbi:MAG: DUF502 domain-containing protein [Sphingomonadaceae bacterium]|nr:DUF502 domain-containing protein [Sphingomonadaceae bacterium]